jgi:hypothetical protein
VEKLLSKHASIPFNPDVASVFFRAGMIESWGRGIERLLEACQEAHTPAPELRYEHTALWVEFRFLPKHTVSATPKITGEVTGEVERLMLALEGPMTRVQIQPATIPPHGKGRGAPGKTAERERSMSRREAHTAWIQPPIVKGDDPIICGERGLIGKPQHVSKACFRAATRSKVLLVTSMALLLC